MKLFRGLTKPPEIDFSERCNVHCKSYVQPSLDKAIKQFQASEIAITGLNVTYSEAMRRLIIMGLASPGGFGMIIIKNLEPGMTAFNPEGYGI